MCGRSEEFRAPCRVRLTQALEADLAAAHARIEMPEGARGLDRSFFESAVKWTYPNTTKACDPKYPPEVCAVAQTSLRWVFLHSLARRMEVSFTVLAARP